MLLSLSFGERYRTGFDKEIPAYPPAGIRMDNLIFHINGVADHFDKSWKSEGVTLLKAQYQRAWRREGVEKWKEALTYCLQVIDKTPDFVELKPGVGFTLRNSPPLIQGLLEKLRSELLDPLLTSSWNIEGGDRLSESWNAEFEAYSRTFRMGEDQVIEEFAAFIRKIGFWLV